jgi:large subunit ribosomal protein L22
VTGLKTNERPGTRAVLRHSRVSAYKAREVLNLIRGQDYQRATEILEYCDRGVAEVIGKLLHSAAANARHNEGVDPDEMYVSACFADEGTTLKRWRPRARGRATRIRKRTCHITVILSRLPDDQLARRRSRVAAEQSERRARRVAGGKKGAEPEATSEAMAALEEARAIETTSHRHELEAEAESALDYEDHDHAEDEDHDDHDDEADSSDEADVAATNGEDEDNDETDGSPSGDVADHEVKPTRPRLSGDGAHGSADEEN